MANGEHAQQHFSLSRVPIFLLSINYRDSKVPCLCLQLFLRNPGSSSLSSLKLTEHLTGSDTLRTLCRILSWQTYAPD